MDEGSKPMPSRGTLMTKNINPDSSRIYSPASLQSPDDLSKYNKSPDLAKLLDFSQTKDSENIQEKPGYILNFKDFKGFK